MDKLDTSLTVEILVPNLETLYAHHNSSSLLKHSGFRTVQVQCSKLQRVQNLIPLLAKQINLKYYKDLRLLLEKEYSQRVLDDD